MFSRRRAWLFCIFLHFLLGPERASAQSSLPLDPSQFVDTSALEPVASEIIKTVGMLGDHRPYQPATALGVAAGVDLSVELTLMKIPDSFKEALTGAGLSSGASIPPVLPSPKLHIHKGLGEKFDVGASLFYFRGYKFIGGDMKLVVSEPEIEGPTVALRFCYTAATIGFVQSKTYTPQVLMSRAMSFADPYIGLGYQYVTGVLDFEKTATYDPGPPAEPVAYTFRQTFTGRGGAMLAFFGVAIRPPNLGIKLTIEGAYSSAGANSLGTKFGFAF
jgi:hypothetical protein